MTYDINTEIAAFVGMLLLNEDDPQEWTIEDAEYNMQCWTEEEIETPEGMTAELLLAEWNSQIA